MCSPGTGLCAWNWGNSEHDGHSLPFKHGHHSLAPLIIEEESLLLGTWTTGPKVRSSFLGILFLVSHVLAV